MGIGRSREEREWQRALAEQLDALPTYDGETPDGGPVSPAPRRLPPPPRRPRRGRQEREPGARPPERRRTVLTVVLTLAVIGTVLVLNTTPVLAGLRGLFGGEADRGPASSHAFLEVQPRTGEPVTWSSCKPIPYVVNPDGAPDGWRRTLAEAMAEVTDASGLEFEDRGTTDDRAFDDRLDGARPLPVLIGWATPEEVPALEGDVVGVAGPTGLAYGQTGRRAPYITGDVVLDAGAFDRMADAGRDDQQRAVVMHELAHLVGLDHVDDERQLMHPSGTRFTTFGNGDLEGLRILGEGPC
ncbi:hypothetical protein GCM10023340_28100 [Nocardioides marinquilinus]|uniref:Peptidase metallopeptidase domain-containing protein n=1 Tax=Nocardioides marinquilinus TaxID=1210400 RepID=A0ABP9PR70_9ACTN